MPNKNAVTWYLIADSKFGQVYVRTNVEHIVPMAGGAKHDKYSEEILSELIAVPEMKWEAESVKQYQIGKNATGMVHESLGGAIHMSEPHIDVHDEVREHFAKLLAEKLAKAAEEKAFDHLVLVAPPKMLGELRKHLNEKVLKLINEEISKDLTSSTPAELTASLITRLAS